MRRPPLSRFHAALIIAACLCVASWALRSYVVLVAVLALFSIVVGLGVTFPQMKFFGPFLCRGKGDLRRVALTFDDGPDPRSTIALLDLLRESKVQAAFFCIGKRVAAHPEVVARIAREGHLVGNHSYSHSNATNLFTVSHLREELRRTQTAIQHSTGSTPECFRPPMGLSNPRIFRAARDLGLKVVGWTARGLDTRITDPQRIVNRIIRQLKPGAIVLLHDGNIPAERLVATVKTLLDRVQTLGYEVVRLDCLLS
jgi:peptidoglycan/xylan/chitin deacetylase (PgdA/CDA1 family)